MEENDQDHWRTRDPLKLAGRSFLIGDAEEPKEKPEYVYTNSLNNDLIDKNKPRYF